MSKVPGPVAATPGTPSSEDYRDLVENLNEGVYRSTPQGRILLANRALADILGYASVEELLHKDIARDFYVDPMDREENLRALARHGAISHYSLRLRKKSGDAILVEETSRAVCDEQGATLYYEGIIEDVTARRHSEQQAQYFGDLFQATIENVSDGVIHLALDGIIRYVNSSIERNAGLGRDQMIGRHFCEVWPNSPALSDQGYGTWADAFQASVERGEPVLLNKFPILCRNDGTSSEKAFVLRLVPQLIEGRMHGVTVFVEFFTEQLQLRKRILQDIRRRKALERELLSARNQLESIFDNASDAIVATDEEGIVVGWNKGAENIFGLKRGEVFGQPISRLFPQDQYFHLYKARRSLMLGEAVRDLELSWTRPDGGPVHLNVSISPIKDEKGLVRGASAIARDMTERKKQKVTLQHLVITDHLTETYNRYYFDQLLQKELTRSQRYGYTLSIVLIDIDGFKEINDRYGHLVGDRVLKESARILKSSIRNSDTLVRYGGDEFLILLPETEESEIQYVVRRIEGKLKLWNETETFLRDPLSFSMGYAGCGAGEEFEKCVKVADRLMYQDKNSKRKSL